MSCSKEAVPVLLEVYGNRNRRKDFKNPNIMGQQMLQIPWQKKKKKKKKKVEKGRKRRNVKHLTVGRE